MRNLSILCVGGLGAGKRITAEYPPHTYVRVAAMPPISLSAVSDRRHYVDLSYREEVYRLTEFRCGGRKAYLYKAEGMSDLDVLEHLMGGYMPPYTE